MIGVLCSNDEEKRYAQQFHSLFKKVGKSNGEKIIVFTILNVDFDLLRVRGTMITTESLGTVEVEIPSVIFNLSMQKDIKGMKARKRLEEIGNIWFINDINKYNQWMIMDILSSSVDTKKNLLPYKVYSKAERDYKPDDEQAYIVMPCRGSSLSRLIYAIPDPNSDKISGTQYFKKGHICDYIDASLCQSHWVFIEVPDIVKQANHPVIIRNYFQKISDNTWRVLVNNVYSDFKLEEDIKRKLDDTGIKMISYLNNFLPTLGICFIDFILGTDMNPYFLHFGGFEQDFFEQNFSENIYNDFYKNMLSLAGSYNRKHRGR